MAQRSKKEQIAQAALALFMEHGIKGTSVDLVVRHSKVSKPTVYNHFPDKTALFYEVMCQWLQQQGRPSFLGTSMAEFERELQSQWLNPTALRLYQLVIGEGARCQEAALAFNQQYHDAWVMAGTVWAEDNQHNAQHIKAAMDAALVQRLLAPN